MMRLLLSLTAVLAFTCCLAQQDTADLEKLRTESGVDPTRVATRVGFSMAVYDQQGSAGQINTKPALTIGVGHWSFAVKTDVVTRTYANGDGFRSGMGDIRFSLLNAFFISGKHAVAGSVEFSIPTGGAGFGSQYFSMTPALTYSYTINPSLILAVQPQYAFDLMRDAATPALSVLTIRSFLAKFTPSGYFFVFEPRPVFDFSNNRTDLVLSPIIGKGLGKGFNLIALMEYPLSKFTRDNRGVLYQFGFNKNF